MGEVYLADDLKLGRQVAIKLLPERFTRDPDRLARFEREARLLASLNHPNIATIHEVGDAEGLHYLVMELADGDTLAKRLGQGPLPVETTLGIGIQIAAGLEVAHARGIVHRDLKPSNVTIRPGGSQPWRVKLLDFGLAKDLVAYSSADLSETRSVPEETSTGVLLGTAGYMSPEQARAQPVDERTDVWSLGCVLYECLSGIRAFGGPTAGDRLAAVLGGEPDWSALPEDVPTSVVRLLRRCLRKDSARRIHSVADVRIELEDALSGESAEGDGAGAGSRGGIPIERHFRLTSEICRLLDREALDPEMIGGNLVYLDNGRVSPILVCHIPGLGLDHRIFEETLVLSPYRCLAPTFYGCEPVSARRIDIPFGDQLVLLREFLADATRRLRPELLILVGFSLGADIAFRLLSEPRGEAPRVAGILSLGCNLSLETCVFSARLADLTRTSSEAMVPALRAMGESVSSVAEWIQVHRYLVEVVAKYLDDFEVLSTASEATVAPFRDPDRNPFTEWFRYAKGAGVTLRCVFTGSDREQAALRRLKLDHLDSEILGPDFHEEDLVSEPGLSHFDLLDPSVIGRHLDGLIDRIRASR